MEEVNLVIDGYGYFIGILEFVWDIFRLNLELGVKFEKESWNEDLDMFCDLFGFVNIFLYFEVEDMFGELMGRVVECVVLVVEVFRFVEVVVDLDLDLFEKFRVKVLFWFDVYCICIFVCEIW